MAKRSILGRLVRTLFHRNAKPKPLLSVTFRKRPPLKGRASEREHKQALKEAGLTQRDIDRHQHDLDAFMKGKPSEDEQVKWLVDRAMKDSKRKKR